MRTMQQQHPFPASMHFPQNVRPRPPLNAAQAMLHQQSTLVQAQQQQAALHKVQQSQHQGIPLQHRIRPPQVGVAGNMPSMRMPMNSGAAMFNPELKNLLQANQAAANGGIGINMNNVKNINQLGLNIMQAQRLSLNGANGQISYPIQAAQLQALNGKGLNSAQLQASIAHQQQINNSNIARQVQFQMIQNQRKIQNQNNNTTSLHSGQSAAALHAINNVHNAKFQAEQVRNRGQMMANSPELLAMQNAMRQQLLQAQMSANSVNLQHNMVANQQTQQGLHHGSPQLSQGSPGITSPLQQTANLSNQNTHRLMNVINNNSPLMSPQHSTNSNIK